MGGNCTDFSISCVLFGSYYLICIMFSLAHATPIDPHWIGPRLLSTPEVARISDGAGGVYLLQVFAEKLGGYPVFYAGRSARLKRRLGEHMDSRRCKGCIGAIRASERTYFSAAILPEHLAAGVEASLVRLLRPVCNDQVPRAVPVLVTLPPLFVTNLLTGDQK